MNPYVIGALLNSALYLSCCFFAGFATHNGWAWRLALAAMGVTFLSYLVNIACPYQSANQRNGMLALSAISIGLGALAGLALLF